MRALVTGGAGFIGSHLVDALIKEGHRVTVVDDLSTGRLENLAQQKGNPRLKFVRADITRLKAIVPFFRRTDVVFHLAAKADIVPSIVNPMVYYTANVTGTLCVVEACRLSGVEKIVYAASSSCYGIPCKFPTPETAPIALQYPYALTKYLGEETLLHWGQVYGISVVSLRLFNVFGERSRTSGAYGAVLGVFLAQQLSGKPFTIVGDGEQKRDFVYVTDVARAFIKAQSVRVAHKIFNVGTGKPRSINYLAKLLGGKRVHIARRPGEPECTWADITRIRKEFGWQPQVSFEDGVKRVLAAREYWRGAPVWTPKKIKAATKDWFRFLSLKEIR